MSLRVEISTLTYLIQTKPNCKTLSDFITSYSLFQPICEPTRFSRQSNSIIDIFLTSPDVLISQSRTLDSAISDHLPIFLEISWKLIKPPIKTIRRRSFKNLNVTEFNEDMSRLPRSILEVFDDVNDKLMAFESLFSDILDLHAPLKSVRIKKNPAPWISRSIRDDMDKKNKLLKRFCLHRTPENWESYRAQRNLVTARQRLAKRNHFHQLIANNSHPSTLWQAFKLATCIRPNSDSWSAFSSCHTSIANSLNDHFLSISTCSNYDHLPQLVMIAQTL